MGPNPFDYPEYYERESDVDEVCVDNHCPICGEFEAECICLDEDDEADARLDIEREGGW